MTKEYNIIGDIAGNYETMVSLLSKMPDAVPVSVGDMIDRGPHSKIVLDYFMEKGIAILGNHEHIMLDELDFMRSMRDGVSYHKYYQPGLWHTYWPDNRGGMRSNGGLATIKSFGNLKVEKGNMVASEDILDLIPQKYIEWIRNLPLYIQEDGLFISHAAKRPDWTLERCCQLGDSIWKPSGKYKDMESSLIWNRGSPRRQKGIFQVHGHMAGKTYWNWKDRDGQFGINLDSSKGRTMTGLHWPSMTVYEQNIID